MVVNKLPPSAPAPGAFSGRSAMPLLCLAVMGCSAAQTTIELISPPPQNYREIVAARIGAGYDEPIILARAEISSPLRGKSQLGASSMVCIRAPRVESAHNAEYSIVSVTFRADEVVNVDLRFAARNCPRDLIYGPFPELQKHYKAPPLDLKPAKPMR